jgi:hypothetical protein
MITKDMLTAVVMTLFEWGLAGGLCGGLLAGLEPVMVTLGLVALSASLAAAALAGMTTAAFYSAMPVALIGAMAGVLASIGTLILAGPGHSLAVIAAAAVCAGLAGGSFFAWMAASTERLLARTLAGLVGGLLAGGITGALAAATGWPMGTAVRAAIVVALVGVFYEISAHLLMRRGRDLLPHGLAAAVVAALIAAMVAAGIWLLGGGPTLAVDGTSHDLLGEIRRELPSGFLGGLLGGLGTGLVLELLGFRLEEHA